MSVSPQLLFPEGARSAEREPPRPGKRHIVFVCYTNFMSNSAIQMFHLANALVDRGNAVTCVVPAPSSTVYNCGSPKFSVAEYDDVFRDNGSLQLNGLTPDVFHAWTPREGVRKYVETLSDRFGCPYMVHLEDNEDYVVSTFTGIPYEDLHDVPDAELDDLVPGHLSHPKRSLEFMAGSAGVTILIDRLSETVPAGTPRIVFYPSCDERAFYARPIDYDRRRELGIEDNDFLITYNGNAHLANYFDMRGLYIAVSLCNLRGGRPVKLLRLGVTDGVDLHGGARELVQPFVIDLGTRPHSEQAPHLSLADALVQPGRPDAFNDFRFPSKLPEFFRMEKPVILPRSNIGLALRDGIDALIMRTGSALELADKIDLLRSDPALCARLASAIGEFSHRFSWASAAKTVDDFYADHLEYRHRH